MLCHMHFLRSWAYLLLPIERTSVWQFRVSNLSLSDTSVDNLEFLTCYYPMHTLVDNFGLHGYPYVLSPVRDGATYNGTYCSSGTYDRSSLGTVEFLVALDGWGFHPCLITAFVYRLYDAPPIGHHFPGWFFFCCSSTREGQNRHHLRVTQGSFPATVMTMYFLHHRRRCDNTHLSNNFTPLSPCSSMTSLLWARLLSRCTRFLQNLPLSLRYCDDNFFQSRTILTTTTLLCSTKWCCRDSFTSCTDIASTSLTRRTTLDSSNYGSAHLLILVFSKSVPGLVCFVYVLGSSPPSLPVI